MNLLYMDTDDVNKGFRFWFFSLIFNSKCSFFAIGLILKMLFVFSHM